MSITTKCIVIEIGSVYIRAGFGGESSPRCFIRNAINLVETTDRKELEIQLHEVLHEIFIERLNIKPKNYSVLFVEKFLGTMILRDCVLTLLLKDFQVN